MDAFIQKFCEKYSLPIALSLQLLDNMAAPPFLLSRINYNLD